MMAENGTAYRGFMVFSMSRVWAPFDINTIYWQFGKKDHLRVDLFLKQTYRVNTDGLKYITKLVWATFLLAHGH